MIRIYLASFLQPENFGPGRIIGICHGNKPRYVKVDTKFVPFIPPENLINQYNSDRLKLSAQDASGWFVSKYSEQLELFCSEVKREAEKSTCTPQEILPFEDEVTLASWERAEFTNYRKILAPFLKDLGYHVILH